MSDLLFIGGAIVMIGLCFVTLIGFAVYELRELLADTEAPKWLKWLVTTVSVGLGMMLLGVALKITENL